MVNHTIYPLNAEFATLIMNISGEGVTYSSVLLASERFSLFVGVGCDGSDTIALFSSALIAFPIPWRVKWQGLIGGILLLFFINVFRIIGLIYSGIHYQELFDFLHGEIFPFIFIIFSIILWVTWIQSASSNTAHRQKNET